MKIIGIYKITSPTGKIYIGQSVNIYNRWRRYKGLYKTSQTKLIRSLKKYGWDNHIAEILVVCKEDELNELEKRFSDLYNSTHPIIGLNIRECGGSKGRLSESTKLKLSKANNGKILSEETKEKIRQKRKLQVFTQATRDKLKGKTPWNKGLPITENQRHKLKTLYTGKIGDKSYASKIINQMGENNNIIKKYNGAREIERLTGYKCAVINRCARGERKTAYGYKWSYAE